MAFVTRTNSTLMLSGSAYRFAGVNISWLGVLEAGLRYPTHFEIDDALNTAVEAGATVVRALTMGISVGSSYSIEPTLGVWNSAAFEPIDYSLYKGAQLGLRFILPLTDSNSYYFGSMATFTGWRSLATTTFYTDTTVIADFKAYINQLMTHVNQYSGIALKDDPAILFWETGNELNTVGGPNTGWDAWTTSIGGYIKSLSSTVLVLDGFYGTYSNTLSAHTPRLANASTDAASSHYYGSTMSAYSTAMTGDAAACVTANKVYLVGEYDWTSASDTLANLTTWHSTLESTTGVSGDCFWQLFSHNAVSGFNTHNDGYSLYYPGNDSDVSSGTQMRERAQQLRSHSYLMRGLSVPAAGVITQKPLITASTIGTGVSNIVKWSGVPGAGTYKIERGPTSDGPWQLLSATQTDLTAPYTDTTSIVNDWYRITPLNVDGVKGSSSLSIGANHSPFVAKFSMIGV